MSENGIVKPCEIVCSKCGSSDISLRYWAKNIRVPSRLYTKYGEYTVYWKYDDDEIHLVPFTEKEFLENTCRRCQYSWLSDTLDKYEVRDE